ncbi:1-(5-phosphoribosyl)-5-[(5-phosphoribosylamino)methylideneamino]imidazole-4-carboxamide isomerase [Campylobacter upsaliensis]|uniref:1-(5-phosphoribosyl)-5-[(5- phosphoribosylamino)methylideneamino]imidazole-4- carboxamide isomerase n=1 Tax=Campylobacter upsaliensis TaxID=28080 RepID=UPI00182C0D77|nr:1-(5-phosphoribosyl)-5-[(5-phosphoribosylamino)methylideneamino]imidazole-4-carboxamide isomerase [Campylobacter upsaliensis]MEB2804523.1 1-(5-phosphoribosyl)-5-[(5-phosphoribosylamino)methylideneamino]imidazole-4-carboxamide isomerase [Campylobacter upsaliensis]MEB2812658.1 1-(5-phosphoribosyl)-5-[(5-phosphoribosylamino)methylideneamino]imidazole-4-carboxamide isomerase [Campylobacter upsaliensis]MEB2823740.1 1-(5-phosphoribosyl)-5-[(5-phosphoribosylamino)methylideneamino]imidazole-4-carboxa
MKSELIPAIDLIDGEIVRLIRGEYESKQSYDFKPLKKLKEYERAGAKWLHLVDLSGAKEPNKRQFELIQSLALNLNANLQVGGGIRTKAEVKNLLESGVKRVVIGSLALTNPQFCVEILREFGADKLCLALDVKPVGEDFYLALNAWQDTSEKKLFEVLEFYAKEGLKHILCTDISKDGTLSGVNAGLYEQIALNFPHIHTQASGGVAGLEDLKKLKGICSGVIVGKALLEGIFSVEEGIKCLEN